MKPAGEIEFYDPTMETVVTISLDQIRLGLGDLPQLRLVAGLWTAATVDLNADNIALLRRLLDQAEVHDKRAKSSHRIQSS